MIDEGQTDDTGRRVTLRDVGDDWRPVADLAPHDDQRDFVAALAARYLLMSLLEGTWKSLAIRADDTVAGHVMWGVDDDGSHWIGGMVIDANQQARGVGTAAAQTMLTWLLTKPACKVVRLSYHRDNDVAARVYARLGFKPTGEFVDDEVVAEVRRAS